jgi:outer membrane protein OmpA-like peptidoglycan-associated protein
MRRLAALLLLLTCSACASMSGPPPAPQKFVVFFQEWSASLDDAAQSSITVAAKWAADHPSETVTVTGYAAPDGSVAANDALSRTRAQVVVDKLTADGVAPGRIRLESRGPTDFTLAAIESRRVDIAIAQR